MTNKLSELIRKSVLNQYVDAEPVIRRWADEVAALEQKLTRRNDAANNWSRMYEEQKAEKEALEQRVGRLEEDLHKISMRATRHQRGTGDAAYLIRDLQAIEIFCAALAEEEA